MSAVVTWTTEMISPLCECDLESQSLCSQQPLHHNHAQDYSGAAMNKVHPPKVERFREKKLQLKSNVGIKCPRTLTGYDPSEYCKQWLCGDGSSGQQKSLRQWVQEAAASVRTVGMIGFSAEIQCCSPKGPFYYDTADHIHFL